MFAVYRATGSVSNLSYYGYATVTEENAAEQARASFLGGAQRSEMERADVRLFQANGADADNIRVTIIDVAEDEAEAWMLRNEQRATSVDTISGPTMFPGHIAERVAKEQPQKIANWKLAIKMRTQKTARDAYALGMWTIDQIKNLAANAPLSQIRKDLDTMTPDQFQVAYFS